MRLLKRALGVVTLTVALALGGGVAANAAPGAAKLVTYGSPYKVQTGGTYCPVFMYYDYNWWEESWFGGSHRDGPVLQYYAYC
jgi:hypothetical protein